jgi:hypothetical protein
LLEKLKTDYKDWQKKADKATKADEDETNEKGKAGKGKKAKGKDADTDDMADDGSDIEEPASKGKKKAGKDADTDADTTVEEPDDKPVDAEDVDKADLVTPIDGADDDVTVSQDEIDQVANEPEEPEDDSDEDDEYAGFDTDFTDEEPDDSDENNENSPFDDTNFRDTPSSDIDTDNMDDFDTDDNTDDIMNGSEEVDDEDDSEDTSYTIADITFDKNLKTQESQSTGPAIVVVPMVDSDGNTYTQTMNVQFYLDDDKNVILNNTQNITYDMYNAVVDAVKSDPGYEDAEGGNYDESSNRSPRNKKDQVLDRLVLVSSIPFTTYSESPSIKILESTKSDSLLSASIAPVSSA